MLIRLVLNSHVTTNLIGVCLLDVVLKGEVGVFHSSEIHLCGATRYSIVPRFLVDCDASFVRCRVLTTKLVGVQGDLPILHLPTKLSSENRLRVLCKCLVIRNLTQGCRDGVSGSNPATATSGWCRGNSLRFPDGTNGIERGILELRGDRHSLLPHVHSREVEGTATHPVLIAHSLKLTFREDSIVSHQLESHCSFTN